MTPSPPIRVLFALPGLHALDRGAEVAFESIAGELGRRADCDVTLIGGGPPIADRSYRFVHAGCLSRDRFVRWPHLPVFRSEYVYEEATFTPSLLRRYRPADFDVTVTCSFPFTNWVLRSRRGPRRPAHVYVTQNGDWPCRTTTGEYRFFGCDGLVCTNPEYFRDNRDLWPSVLIPNGVDPDRFGPGDADRSDFGIGPDGPVVLMVSALIETKRVVEGVRAAAAVDGVRVVAAGDGPLRDEVRRVGASVLGDRFQSLVVPRERMPALYRCADVFLHMSQVEPSANAYMEALATGLPIVTHERTVTRWTLEDTGVLVDTNDDAAVAAGIRAGLALRGPADVESRRDLVRRRFTWSAIADAYREFFAETIARRARGGELTTSRDPT